MISEFSTQFATSARDLISGFQSNSFVSSCMNSNVGQLIDAAVVRLISEVDQWDPLKFTNQETDGVNRLGQLPETITLTICMYLKPSDIVALMRTSRQFELIASPLGRNGSLLWMNTWRNWCPDQSRAPTHQVFLRNKLQYERDELRHWQSIEKLATALKMVDVIDISGNVGRFPDRRIATAVTRRRPQALLGAIVADPKVGEQFRRVTTFRSSVSFMVNQHGSVIERPMILATGFIGYAIDLLELRPEEEDLREKVLASFVYRDLTVWDSLESVRQAFAAGLYRGDFFCTLDDARNEIEIADDDAPRHPNGVAAELPESLRLPCAPYGEFRPRLRSLRSVSNHVEQIRQRVRNLEYAVIPSQV